MPSSVLVKVDRHRRLALLQYWRGEVTTTPGEVVLTRTQDGLVITPVVARGSVPTVDDGLPVLRVGHVVTNDEVLASIAAEQGSR